MRMAVEQTRYWLWILLKSELPTLWDLCRNTNCVAMHYPPGWTKEQENQNRALRISIGDFIICHIQNKTIGGIGRATSTKYNGPSWINQLNQFDFQTRVNVEWLFSDPIGYKIPNNKSITQLLGISRLDNFTVHELTQENYENTLNYIQETFLEN